MWCVSFLHTQYKKKDTENRGGGRREQLVIRATTGSSLYTKDEKGENKEE